ncbi:hypothetical protein [Ancylobacter amanitiformis]|uniref:DUF3618 domain-containing protein n=1 Tax=Ancylobacter amanitiformis TaxID=217069 RepID=A0ABU0LQZ3_9HYPH|nr:hypothetical protein [Ancylobacter amanitiformis]MDQ0511115.1 hypothetical protein [Ancylobacter amanitiformis]
MATSPLSPLSTAPPVREPAPAHPEEIKAVFEARLGRFATFQASARVTPAGVVTAGIAGTALLFGVAAVLRACLRR